MRNKKILSLLLIANLTLSMTAMTGWADDVTSDAAVIVEDVTQPNDEAAAQPNDEAAAKPADETASKAETASENAPVKIKALILPKFEVDNMSDDFPGEAQFYYDAYCKGGEEYDIAGGFEDNKLYVKDGVALYVTGMGKVNAALSTAAVLNDKRFDFSDAYILSTGCAGSSVGTSVMGDVYLITAAVDYDLGHKADIRDMTDQDSKTTWFHDESYDSTSCKILDSALMDKVYDMIKNVKIDTTEKTKNFMSVTFDNADWATRDPEVLRGTGVSGDNYWKGEYDHENALLMAETYQCPDAYAVTEMEDVAIADAVDRAGMLDHLIILRDSVNMDVFMNGATPESLWDPNFDESLASEDSVESADIFATAMENNFKVGSVIIDAVLDGTF